MKRRTKIKRRITRRRKKNIFTNFYFSFSVFASIIILSAAGFLLFSSRFQISKLSVSGNSNISTEDLEQAAQKKLKTSFSFLGMDISTESIFLSASGAVTAITESFPEIEKVTIKKNFPNGVSVEVVEKTPYAVWIDEFDSFKCYLIDNKGSYIKNCAEGGDYSSLIKVNEKDDLKDLDKKDALQSFEKISEKLKVNSIVVTAFNIYNGKTIIDSNLACKIIFNISGDDLDWQIEKLGIVLTDNKYSSEINKLEYIDLRFGNQAIIR